MKGFSVQSSFKHNLPLHLIIPSANIKLDDTIGQGMALCMYIKLIINHACLNEA